MLDNINWTGGYVLYIQFGPGGSKSRGYVLDGTPVCCRLPGASGVEYVRRDKCRTHSSMCRP